VTKIELDKQIAELKIKIADNDKKIRALHEKKESIKALFNKNNVAAI